MEPLQLHYDKGEGKTVILLHGLFGTLSNWERVASYLTGSFRVLIPRLPLYDEFVTDKSLNRLVKFLEDFVDERCLNSVVLVGNSLGGHIALLYTLLHPDRVEKMILSGSSGLYENLMGGTFPRIRDYNYINEIVSLTFHKKEVVTAELVDEVYATIQDRPKTMSIIGLARAAQKQNLADELSNINTPTLLIWGLQDEITPVESALEFHARIKNSELRLINECGHVPMMEQPDLFNKYLLEFLNT